MLFDQDRLDAIIHNWKNQVFSNKTIHGVPRSAFDVFEAAYRRVPEPRVQSATSSPLHKSLCNKGDIYFLKINTRIFQAPTGGVCGIVQDRDNMFVVQWGSTATAADDGQQQQTKSKWPAPPSRLLRGFDPETAERMAAIKQLEAALRRREKVGAEARRLAAQHARVQSARLAHRVVSVVNDF